MNNTKARCPKCGATIPPEATQGLCPHCALGAIAAPTEADPPRADRPPQPSLETVAGAFPHLEIVELIGAGGLGAVYKARQRKLKRLVTLKSLTQPPGAQGVFAERFGREARLLARLNHPGIVSVYDGDDSADLHSRVGARRLSHRGKTDAPELHRDCEAYYMPVLAFIRRGGRDEDAARDLAQEFFRRLLTRPGLAGVAPARGRFRSYEALHGHIRSLFPKPSSKK